MEYSDKGLVMRRFLEEMEFDKRLHPFDVDFFNPVERFLYKCDYRKPIIIEGLIHTYPPEKTINYISKALKIDLSCFEINHGENGIERIFVKINEQKTPRKLVIAAFGYCGYFHSLDKEARTTGDGVISTLVFEQRNQKDDTVEILANNKVLYHVSPSVFEGSILKIGLSPRTKNNYFKYPERVYLIEEGCKETYIFNLAWQISESISYDNFWKGIDNGYKDPYSWTIYKIDVGKMRKGTRLFKDPNWRYGIFTPDNVPPESIIGIGHFDFNTFLETNNTEDVKIQWNIR